MGTIIKRIILALVPVMWVHKLEAGEPGTIEELWRFDNLADGCGIKLLQPAANESGDNLDITRGDGAIFRFPKFNLIMDKDEADITPAEQSSDATNKAEITAVTNEAPLPATIASWTAWMKEFYDTIQAGDLLMFTLPTGFTYDSRENQNKADGYVTLLVKVTSDFDQKLGVAPSTLQIVGASNKSTLSGVTGTIIEGATFTAISWKGKGFDFAGPSLQTGDGETLMAGEPVFTEEASYA
jgi:hypothetical protein